MKSRLIAIFLAVLVVLPAFVFASGKGEDSASGGSGKEYDGVELVFLVQGGAEYDIPNQSGSTFLEAMAEEFYEETGAKVRIVGAPWENLMPKIINDVTTGANQFDGGLYDIEFQYSIEQYLEPLDGYIEDTGYDMDGFVQPVYDYGVWSSSGKRYGLPMTAGAMAIIYRSDILKSIPETWDGYWDALQKIKSDGDVKYAVTIPGVSAQLVKMFLCHFWATGDVTMNPDWSVNLNDENGVMALKNLERTIRDYAAPGALGYDNPDAANEFINGDAAIYQNWTGFIMPSLVNPDTNAAVRDKWSLGPFPKGGTGNFVQHNMIVMAGSKNKQAAFDYVASCTSEENQVRFVLDFGGQSARASVLTNPDVLAASPWMADYKVVLDNGRPIFPAVPYWLEMFVSLADGLGRYMSGEISDPQVALDDVAAKWDTLIEENPLPFAYKE